MSDSNRIVTPEGFVPGVIDPETHPVFTIGAVRRALRRAGNGPEVLAAFTKEALSGDYDHILQTCIAYTEPEDES